MSAITLENELNTPAPAPSLWRNRTYVSILLGHIVSVLGDGFHSVALGYWVLKTTGSGTAMATIMSVRVVISILLGAVAGTVADRVDRRRLMIVTNVLRFFLVGALALLVTRDSVPFALMVGLYALMSICGNFFGPAFQASLTNIVDKENLPKASGTLQVATTLSQVVGPTLGGMVVGLFGASAAFTADASSFLVSAALILLGGAFLSPKRDTVSESFWGNMKAGFGYIRKDDLVKSILAVAPLLNLFANALFGVLLPLIAVKVWLASSTQFGTMEAMFPLGMGIGAAAIMATVKKMKRRGLWMIGGIFAASVLAIGVPLSGSMTHVLPVMLALGAALALPNVILQIILQAEVPEDMQGRVFGTFGSLCNMATPLAFMAAGRLGDLYSPIALAVICGVCMTLVAVFSFFTAPALRNYK